MTKSEQLLLSAVSLWSNGVVEMQIWIHSPMLSPSLCHKSRWDPWMQTQTQTLNFKLVNLSKNFIQRGLLRVIDLMLDDNFFSSVYVGKLVQNEIFLTFFRFQVSFTSAESDPPTYFALFPSCFFYSYWILVESSWCFFPQCQSWLQGQRLQW